MEIIGLKKGQVLAKKNDPVKEWYIIQEGEVIQKNDFVETRLGVNSIIGMLEQDFFICDYIAKTDCTFIMFTCRSVSDLKHFLEKEAKMRTLFLKTAISQRFQQFKVYDRLYKNANKFSVYVDKVYQEYQSLVIKNRFEYSSGPDLSSFQPLNVTHTLSDWELDSLDSIVHNHANEYMKLYTSDDKLSLGAIMEASLQMHRVAQGISQMIEFFGYNRDHLISDRNRDIFHGYIALMAFYKRSNLDTGELEQTIEGLLKFATNLGIYDSKLIDRCKEEYDDAKHFVQEEDSVVEEGPSSDLEFILDYAGFLSDSKKEYIKRFTDYSKCYTKIQRDKESNNLRKQINNDFYDIYKKCFLRAVNDRNLPATVEMFLNFGYVDGAFLEEDKINGLFSITNHMELVSSDHVFTIFNWLKAVYRGDREPSKNEFDLDFEHYLIEEYKQGNIKKEEIDRIKEKPEERVSFEIDNMFKTVNRLTYGNISSFNAIMNDNDLFNDPTNMLVSRNKIYEAVNGIRSIDFSAYYRPVFYNNLPDAIKNEALMSEILPDFILMPNCGSKGMMWQETASVKNDTPARFMLPIFATCDIADEITILTARYRWELCRKIQGPRWNDIREHSLTSDYYDYLQFYKKNHELSQDAKDQIKSSLVRSKNSFREVFAKDYFNWIKYESKGGFRLNKFVREIVFTYCPFSKDIRSKLEDSPMFSNAIHRFNVNNAKSYKRLKALYDTMTKNGVEITPLLKENIDYYEL